MGKARRKEERRKKERKGKIKIRKKEYEKD